MLDATGLFDYSVDMLDPLKHHGIGTSMYSATDVLDGTVTTK